MRYAQYPHLVRFPSGRGCRLCRPAGLRCTRLGDMLAALAAPGPRGQEQQKQKNPGRVAVQCVTRLALAFVFAARLGGAVAPATAAEANEFHIARQPGLVYMQAILMEEGKLVEKHAAALGLADIKVKYSIITSGGVMTEALLSNSIDMAITGVSNMLLAWGKTNGGVKSVAGMA